MKTLVKVIFLVLIVFIAGIVTFIFVGPANAQTDERCFDETGFCISGPIRAYWEANGGLPVFGYPTTEQRTETVERRSLEIQWFERDRLEIQTQGFVTAGRLGARLLELRGTPWETFPRATETPEGCTFFEVTGHTMCPPFSTYWEANGGLERFGYPITQPLEEAVEGQTYTVQYFERRRMEIHTELPGDPILLGLLGNEIRNAPTPSACEYDVAPGLGVHLATETLERTRLGCPEADYSITEGRGNAAEQYFERGVMVYTRAPEAEAGTIYVVKTEPLPVTYRSFADTWAAGQPESGGETPPAGLIEPKRGFGKIWREQSGVRDDLGWAMVEERPEQALVQRFENGLVIWLRDADFVYTLYGEDGVMAKPRRV